MPKYIKTKSNYVLKKEHRRTVDGTIFERDYMTITDKDGFSPSNKSSYGQYKFRFVVNEGLNLQKKHQRGSWLENDAYCIENYPEYWTEGCLPEFITPETKIELNPNYESLKDFAYYGSAVELVRASLTDIIFRFPAELYFTNDSSKPKNWGVSGTSTSARYYVENDYGINIHTPQDMFTAIEAENPIRYFANGVEENYVVITPNGDVKPINSWTVTDIKISGCADEQKVYKICDVSIGYDGGSLNMEVWNLGPGETVIVSKSNKEGFRIRPNDTIINDFFNSLDGLEKLMLSKQSVPIYTMNLNTPYDTDDGYFYKKETYTWPNSHGWNPSLSSYAYDLYVQRLVSLAEYHDEYDTDNVWRSMTHEAIKNLDWTFTKETSDDIEEYETIDTSRIAPVLRVWGRQYDDIKRYIDNIKFINAITYNKQNNTPDYFVTDLLESGGWESSVLTVTNDNDIKTNILYSGQTEGYTSSEVNIEVLRRLRLNSPYLLRKKGTVSGIKCLLGLFGIDANIKEYVRNVGNVQSYHYNDIVEKNLLKTSLQGEELPDDLLTGLLLKQSTNGEWEIISNPTQTEICRIQYFYDTKLELDVVKGKLGDIYAVGGEGPYDENKHELYTWNPWVVPWYDGWKQYDGDTYFQMKGGWAKSNRDVKRVGTTGSTVNITEWTETTSNLKFAANLIQMSEMGSLIVKTGDICYVEDISDFSIETSEGHYTPYPGETADTVENASHYFVLENDEYSSILGYRTDYGSYGWRSILQSELVGNTTTAATKVHYYESVIDTNVGNNPHNGEGVYDGGEEFFYRMKNPFQPAIDAGEFDNLDDSEISGLTSVTFNISSPSTAATKTKYYSGDTVESYSVLNDKKLTITFTNPAGTDANDFKEYVMKKVLPYLEQMIPSTAIVEYDFG